MQGQWALPGGFVDEDEPLDHAAARELKEETSLDASKSGVVLEQVSQLFSADASTQLLSSATALSITNPWCAWMLLLHAFIYAVIRGMLTLGKCNEQALSSEVLAQIGAFGDPGRDSRGWCVSVAYAALVPSGLDVEAAVSSTAMLEHFAWFPLCANANCCHAAQQACQHSSLEAPPSDCMAHYRFCQSLCWSVCSLSEYCCCFLSICMQCSSSAEHLLRGDPRLIHLQTS